MHFCTILPSLRRSCSHTIKPMQRIIGASISVHQLCPQKCFTQKGPLKCPVWNNPSIYYIHEKYFKPSLLFSKQENPDHFNMLLMKGLSQYPHLRYFHSTTCLLTRPSKYAKPYVLLTYYMYYLIIYNFYSTISVHMTSLT